MKKYKWTTYKVVWETADTITIYFDTGSRGISFLPGQYLNIHCEINGERVSRSYSFSSLPSDVYPAITVKKVPQGKMSTFLLENATGIAEWEVEGPFGNFVIGKEVAIDAQYVFLAGGSGISPLFSMLRSLNSEESKPLLLYSNKTYNDIIYKEELEELELQNKLNVFHALSLETVVDQPTHISGRFNPMATKSILSEHVRDLKRAHFFICGPVGLIKFYKEVLTSLEVPSDHIHIEFFDPIPSDSGALISHLQNIEILVSYYEDVFFNKEVKTVESTTLIEVEAGESLLDALKENDFPVPNSCKNGTCGTCWATKAEGKIKMANNYVLTEEELSAGMILLCQSYPEDDNVTIVLG